MTGVEKEKLSEDVQSTGFPFEQYVSVLLKKHGWVIIPNRYYIDDVKGIEREIDILAYKYYVDEEEQITFYTSLIISCKKSKQYKWCFFTRDADKEDVNVNYFPFHYFTNDERLKYEMESHLSTIEEAYKKDKSVQGIYSFPKTIISYQEYYAKHQPEKCPFPKNEDIYNSIVSTIKALESEKGQINSRLKNKKNKKFRVRFYSFHLLSLFDGEMVECSFDDDCNTSIDVVNEMKYLNRHIVNKQENFYFTHFITKDYVEKCLSSYDNLSALNQKIIPAMISSFYKDIFNVNEKVRIFWDDFVSETQWAISYTLQKYYNTPISTKIVEFGYENNILNLDIDTSTVDVPNVKESDIYKCLNNNEKLKHHLQSQLLKYYRYSGEFKFDICLPF